MEKTAINMIGMDEISTWDDLIALWPSRAVLAGDLGVAVTRVHKRPRNGAPAAAPLPFSALQQKVTVQMRRILALLHDAGSLTCLDLGRALDTTAPRIRQCIDRNSGCLAQAGWRVRTERNRLGHVVLSLERQA